MLLLYKNRVAYYRIINVRYEWSLLYLEFPCVQYIRL